MERTNKIKEINKKERFISKIIHKSISSTSILKLTIALALFLIAALLISGAGVTVENGALNVSNSLIVNTTTLFVDSANQRVGIGTTGPGYKLQVTGSQAVGSVGVEDEFALQRPIANGVSQANWALFSLGRYSIADTDAHSRLDIKLADVINPTVTVMTLQANGNVGIGTTSPSGKLHVVGNENLIEGANEPQLTLNATSNQASLVISKKIATDYGQVRWQTGGVDKWSAGMRADESFTIYDFTNNAARLFINQNGNVGIGTTSPNQKLMVSGNANITGTVYYGALQANSPVLERTSEPFAARCTIADDGKLVVEYIHAETGTYSRVIEAVNSDSASWYHRSCFEKNEKFKYLDSLLKNEVKVTQTVTNGITGEVITVQREPTIEDIGFDWNSKTAFVNK